MSQLLILTQDHLEWKNHDIDWGNGGKPTDTIT